MILFEFKCPKHGVFDAMAKDNKAKEPCPTCHHLCSTIISPVRSKLDGTDPAFPTAWDKWAKDQEKKARKAKREQETLKRYGE